MEVLVRLLLAAIAVGCVHPAYAQMTSAVTQTVSEPKEVVPAADANSARIGAGDLLTVEVYPDESYLREVRVGEDGSVTLPLVGTLQWQDKTIRQCEQELQNLLRQQYYRDPRVIIRVKEAYSSVVSILGAVMDPKIVPVYGSSDVLKVLGAAGGFNKLASGRLIVVRGGSATKGEDVSIVDGRGLLERGDFAQNLAVFPGDTIFAPTAEKIYVFGQIKEPGSYEFTQGVTLLRAITLAGGLSDAARSGSIEVLSRGDGSEEKRMEYDIDDILRKKIDDPVLMPDDVVVVPERFF